MTFVGNSFLNKPGGPLYDPIRQKATKAMFKPDMPAAAPAQTAPEDQSQYWTRQKAVMNAGGPGGGVVGARSTYG